MKKTIIITLNYGNRLHIDVNCPSKNMTPDDIVYSGQFLFEYISANVPEWARLSNEVLDKIKSFYK